MKSLLTCVSVAVFMIAPCALAESPDAERSTEAAVLQATVVPAGSNAVATPVTESTPAESSSCLPSNELEFFQGPLPGGGGGPGGGGAGGGSSSHYTCDASVLCSGGGVIPNYVLTCQGEVSCSSSCSWVKCDGIGTLCFFGGANC